jgi:hypothetical protein
MMDISDYDFDSGDDDYDLISDCSSVPSITEDPEWITYRDYTFPYDFPLPLQEELGKRSGCESRSSALVLGFLPR